MREIKYRAWDKNNEEMCEVEKILSFKDNMHFILNNPNADVLGNCYGASLDWVELMQYTGYKAKGNTEIYEGDVIKGDIKGAYSCFGITGEVVFGFGSFYVEKEYPTGYKERVLLSKLKNIEVIGNIYKEEV